MFGKSKGAKASKGFVHGAAKKGTGKPTGVVAPKFNVAVKKGK
jgi:hypothetical protein